MAIDGPVRDLVLSDLLQLLFLSRRTGNLVVSDEVNGQSVVLELDNGALAGATSTTPETRLGRLLVGSGRATEKQIESALMAQQRTPGNRLGEILAERGVVRTAEIRRHLRMQVEEAVFELMRWEDGHVRFEERPIREPGGIEVRLPTDIVLMDTARRLDEWAEVTASAPEPDPLPRLVSIDRGGTAPLFLEPFQWEVLAKIDGENTLRRIARSLGRPELEVARAIYSLASIGIVEIGGRSVAESPPSGDAAEAEMAAVEDDLRASRTRDAERRIQSLLTTWPGSAALHLLHGRALAQRTAWTDAMHSFEQAIELDPLLAGAYFHLARAALRAGELERADRALDTYLRLHDSDQGRRLAATKIAVGLNRLLEGLQEVNE